MNSQRARARACIEQLYASPIDAEALDGLRAALDESENSETADGSIADATWTNVHELSVAFSLIQQAREAIRSELAPLPERTSESVTAIEKDNELAKLRISAELRWCKQIRSLLDLMPEGFSLAVEDSKMKVSRTNEEGTVVMDRVPIPAR